MRIRVLISAAVLAMSAASARRATCESQQVVANQHFTEAISLLDRGEIDAAIAEFEEALRVRPHFAVLYDLGHAYGLAGRPVEAADALRLYLAEGGQRINARRRAEASAAVRLYEGIIGTLVVTVPQGTTVVLDGKPIPNDKPIRLRAGPHGLVAMQGNRTTSSQTVYVNAGQITRMTLEAPEAPEPASHDVSSAWLQTHCDVPDVSLSIDGDASPQRPAHDVIGVPPGLHQVAFSRSGYVEHVLTVTLVPRHFLLLDCGLTPRPDLTPDVGVPINLRVAPRPDTIQVDGKPYSGSLLPFGRHRVKVARAGFQPWTGFISLNAFGPTPRSVTLEPTNLTIRARAARDRKLRTWGYLTAGGSVALGAIGSGLMVAQSHEIAAWRRDRATLVREIAEAPATQDQLRREGDQAQRAADIQRTGDAAVAVAVAAGALLVASVILFVSSADDGETARVHRIDPQGLHF